jgi:DNA-3-methyladenine glycosylase
MRIGSDFYMKDVLELGPAIIGKTLVRVNEGIHSGYIISEVEAYRGVEDLACHASKGRTKRTEIMFHAGGFLYIYYIYGMYFMLNIVTGSINEPQALLIRGVRGIKGPGRLTKALKIDRSFYGESLISSPRIWIEDGLASPEIIVSKRIGVEYAGDYWGNKLWRWELAE